MLVQRIGENGEFDPFTTAGETAERHLDYIVDWVKRMMEPYQSSRGYVETHVLLLTPVIASIFAKAGYSKDDVATYLMKNAVVPARYGEGMVGGAEMFP